MAPHDPSLLLRSVREVFGAYDGQEGADLLLACEDGHQLSVARSLLLASSPLMRALLAPSTSSSSTIHLTGVSSSKLPLVLELLGSEWEEMVVDREHMDILHMLGVRVNQPENVATKYTEAPTGTTDEANPVQKQLAHNGEENHVVETLVKLAKCFKCKVTFSNADSVEDIAVHMADQHFHMEARHHARLLFADGDTCNSCGKQFRGDYLQKEHVVIEHTWAQLTERVNAVIEGSVCNREKTTTTTEVIVSTEKPGLKDEVGKSKSDESASEYKSCTNKNRFKCDLCSQSYTTKGNLNIHMRNKHNDHKTKKLNVSCEMCDFKTHLESNLENHEKNRHINYYKTKLKGLEIKKKRTKTDLTNEKQGPTDAEIMKINKIDCSSTLSNIENLIEFDDSDAEDIHDLEKKEDPGELTPDEMEALGMIEFDDSDSDPE